jgi:DNA invertase Pin-like site-specific DNA recombinase
MKTADNETLSPQQKPSAANAADCRKEDNMKQSKITALYERLSREDGDNQESNSIATQKRILETYAEQNGLTPYKHYPDDGFSGKDFQRPKFLEMLAEIEQGNVGAVLVKNLDRFGRSYLESGLYREMFRKLGVRFIAVGDGIDTDKGEDDFMPFREVINEFYLREYSKKIKAAFRSRGMAGKHTNSCPPYGYLKSKEDKNQWIVDPEAAAVVRRIFQLTMDGKGPYQICCVLEADKVKIPGAYLAEKGVGLHKSHVFENPYHWSSTTVIGILKKKEYLGHTVNFKSAKDSYKDKKNHYVPESEWVIFENTHEWIIDEETFNNVQRIRANIKRRADHKGYTHPLTGLVYCADCGGKLYCHSTYNGKDMPQYVCGNYAKVDIEKRCVSGHRIDAAKLMKLIADTLKDISDYAKTDKAAFAQSVQERLASQKASEIKEQKKRLAKLNKRAAELETLLRKVYEDNALGKLPDKRFEALSEQYEQEQETTEREIAELQAAVERFEDGSERAAKFTELVNRYTDFEEMTVQMLNEFVEKIIVHERDRRGAIDTSQKVEIHLNFIGEYEVPKDAIDPAVLAAQEEEERKTLERREQLHQAYLKRKESGVQKRYYDKCKAKKGKQPAPPKEYALASKSRAKPATESAEIAAAV